MVDTAAIVLGAAAGDRVDRLGPLRAGGRGRGARAVAGAGERASSVPNRATGGGSAATAWARAGRGSPGGRNVAPGSGRFAARHGGGIGARDRGAAQCSRSITAPPRPAHGSMAPPQPGRRCRARRRPRSTRSSVDAGHRAHDQRGRWRNLARVGVTPPRRCRADVRDLRSQSRPSPAWRWAAHLAERAPGGGRSPCRVPRTATWWWQCPPRLRCHRGRVRPPGSMLRPRPSRWSGRHVVGPDQDSPDRSGAPGRRSPCRRRQPNA